MDFKAKKTTRDSITLGWKKPISNGGSHVSAYILEQSEDGKWKQIMKSKDTSYSLSEVTEGKEYLFRVKALNESGEGPPAELSVLAKDQFGENLLSQNRPACVDAAVCLSPVVIR